MIKIWGRNTSSNVQKAMWAVGELRLEHTRIDVGGAFGKNKEPAYLAMNPNGLVPTLEEEDGFLLWESNSIVRYLAGKHDKNGVLEPKDAKQRALASQWMDWQLSVVGPAITPAFWGLIRTPAEKRDAAAIKASQDKTAAANALVYMGLTPGTPLRDLVIDTVFLGSCTNGRIEDLRAAAEIIKGRTKAPNTRFLVVPGSARVRLQAEAEGLDKVFLDFGAEWRNAGCSMCLGMNPDQLRPQERSASTSNRNFEGRQGKGGRTHLVSPLVAAATAIRGTLSSLDDLDNAPSALV